MSSKPPKTWPDFFDDNLGFLLLMLCLICWTAVEIFTCQ